MTSEIGSGHLDLQPCATSIDDSERRLQGSAPAGAVPQSLHCVRGPDLLTEAISSGPLLRCLTGVNAMPIEGT
jgi:hypothetical protein